MVLFRYTGKRFFLYFLGIAFFFAFLFNLVEFFEKLIRVSSSTISSVSYFILLHFGPSFVTFLPLASWLATVILIKEYHQKHEWHTFSLLMVHKRNLIFIFLLHGVIAGLGSLVINEFFMLPIASQAEQYRAETFKKRNTITLHNKSFWLRNNIYCSIEFLDCNHNYGTGLTLAYLSPSFEINEVLSISHFSLDENRHTIKSKQGIRFITETNKSHDLASTNIHIPSFFTSVNQLQEFPTLGKLATTISAHHELLSYQAYLTIFEQLLQRVLFYLQIIISPIFTLTCFVTTEKYGKYKWIALILPYLLFIILSLLTPFFLKSIISIKH